MTKKSNMKNQMIDKMNEEKGMIRPLKDESMIDRASTIHEQMLLDLIEKQEKYIDYLESN